MEPKKLKVILIGDSSVGKTTLISRWDEDQFNQNVLPTINAGIVNINVEIDEKNYILQVWDTAGQEKYRALVSSYFQDSLAAMIVCDITLRQSFINIRQWVDVLNSSASDVPFLFVANKYDLVEQGQCQDFVKYDELQQVSDELNCPFFITSARTGNGVNEAFQTLADLALTPRTTSAPTPIPQPQTVEINQKDKQKQNEKKDCC